MNSNWSMVVDVKITIDNYEQVYENYSNIVERSVYKYAKNEDLRDDLRQESRLVLLQAIEYYTKHPQYEFAPLLQTFISRRIRNVLRRKYKMLSGLSKGDLYDGDRIVVLDTEIIEQMIAGEDVIELQEQRIAFESMLDTLSEKDQKMMHAIYYGGLTFK